jgi:hypothetical protein
MKTPVQPSFVSRLVTIILSLGLLVTSSSRGESWVQLNVDMKGSHDTHSGSSSKESHHRWLEIELSGMSLKETSAVQLKWTFFADDLDNDKVISKAGGTETVELAQGKAVTIKTKEIVFDYVRQHSEKSGSGRKSKYKLVKATGQRYHGWAVQAVVGDKVVGEAYSSRDIASLIQP